MTKNLPLDVLVEAIAHKNKHKLKINKCEKFYYLPTVISFPISSRLKGS